MNQFQLMKSESFGTVRCDFYSGRDDFYMTREQIGMALEYADPRDAIFNLHARHKERLDQFSITLKLRAVDGKLRETTVYSRKGVMEICRWSRQPKADAFMDWTWGIMDDLASGRAALLYERQTSDWQQARLESKDFRKAVNDTIKCLIPYAIAQGSTHPDKLYEVYARLIKGLVGYDALDLTDRMTLSTVTMLLRLTQGIVLQEMALDTHYKVIYQRVKAQLAGIMGVLTAPRISA